MDTENGTDQLLVVSRSGTGHVLRFDMSFGILSKRPEFETWNQLQLLKEFACVAHKQFVYIIGGHSIKLKRAVPNLKRYDISSKEWSDLPIMEMERRLCTAIVFNDEIIVCGGFKNMNKLHSTSEIFNISRNKWRKGPSFKNGLADLQLVVIKDSIFGLGGLKQSHYKKETIFCSNDQIFEYRDHFKEWSLTDENIPLILGKPVYNHAVVEVESKIYIIGGLKTILNSNGDISEVINAKVESLCMDDTQLSSLGKNNLNDWISPWDHSLPAPAISRYGATAISTGHDIYLLGGISAEQPNGVFVVEKFNSKRSHWNTEFVIKHEVDLSMVCAIKIFGSHYKRNKSIIPVIVEDTIVIEPQQTDDVSETENVEKMYKVGWILW